MQHTGGRRHWFGDHPKGLTNAFGIEGWVDNFRGLDKILAANDVKLVNCTHHTALTFLPRGCIKQELARPEVPAEITVACVLRSGGDYTAEYVSRLRDAVAQHLAVPHRFVCLSDIDVPCERVPLLNNWPGWWSKLELFRPGLFHGPVLYFDLDTIVQGDITPLARQACQFAMLTDFCQPRQLASGVMLFRGDFRALHDNWQPSRERLYRTRARWGDQGWIAEQLAVEPKRLQALVPGLIASYKTGTPAELRAAAVVCFHGNPRPHEVNWDISAALSRRPRKTA